MNDECSTATITGLPNPIVDYTFCCWIKTTNASSYKCLFSFNDIDTGWYLHNGNLMLFYHNTPVEEIWSTATAFNDGAWHHVAFVRSGGAANNLAYYLDGVANGTSTSAATIVPAATNRLFSSNLGAEYYNGTADEIRFYTRALTLAQINSLPGF